MEQLEFIGFFDAYRAMCAGKMVARHSFGAGVFVFMQVPSRISKDVIPNMTSLPRRVRIELEARGQDLQYKNQFAIVDADNNIQSWSPLPYDIAAMDWFVLK